MATSFFNAETSEAVADNIAYYYVDAVGPVVDASTPEPEGPGDSPIPLPGDALVAPGYLSEWRVIHKTHEGTVLGETGPDDLRFGTYINRPGYTNYNVHKLSELGRLDVCEPYAHDYEVLYGSDTVHEGILIGMDADTDNEYIGVAGNGWIHYLEKILLPFDPDDPTKYNLNSNATEDIAHFVQRVLNVALGQIGALKLFYNNSDIGIFDEQHVQSGNFETLYSIIDRMANVYPGFDYDIQNITRQFRMFSPEKGVHSPYVLELGKNVKSLHYSNDGIESTQLFGVGAGSSNTRMMTLQTNGAAVSKYRLLQSQVDLGDVSTKSLLKKLGQMEIRKASAPKEQIWVTIVPEAGENVFKQVADGDYVQIQADLGYKELNDEYRCTGMEGYVDREGNQTVVLTFGDNQGSF